MLGIVTALGLLNLTLKIQTGSFASTSNKNFSDIANICHLKQVIIKNWSRSFCCKPFNKQERQQAESEEHSRSDTSDDHDLTNRF